MNDLRFAFRQLLKNPGFAAVAVLTLALGIGANTAIFSVVNAVLLRPLPFKEPEQLVTVWERNPKQGYDQNVAAPANYADWKEQSQSFEELAMFGTVSGLNMTGADDPARVDGVAVTANLFQTLGVSPVLGRGFIPEEETEGRDRVVMLSYRLWQRRFGSDPDIVGKTVSLDGNSYSVIGVMPRGFSYPGGSGEFLGGMFFNSTPDLWMPLALSADMRQARGWHDWQVVGRLKAGVSLDQARAEMNALQARIEQANPGNFMGTACTLIPLREQSVGAVKTALLVLLGAVAFVLLIACANVANLLLVRAAARQKEFAIRAALGAGRWAIMRQLVTESVLLAVLGCAVGTLLAQVCIGALVATVGEKIAESTPGWSQISIDGRVLALTVTVSFCTGILFGLAPAWQAVKTDVSEPLKEGGRGLAEGPRRNRLRSALIVAEVALATILLVGAGLMLQSFVRLQRVNPGFNPARVLTMELGLPTARFPEARHRVTFVDRLCERLKTLPGVEFAGATTALPLSGIGINLGFEVAGRPPLEPGKFETAEVASITPGYLRAMQIALRAGRSFEARDAQGAPRVCLISRALANRQFRNENPLGKKLRFFGDEPWEIIGVVQDVKHRGLDTSLFDASIFVPYAQGHFGNAVSLTLRTSGDPTALASAVRAVVRELDKDQPIAKLRPMEKVLGASIAQPRFRTLLLGIFAGLAVLLAAVGLYGVLAYTVAQRTHEIGIRMALGAQMGNVLALILRNGMAMAWIGIGIGLAGALMLTRVLSGFLYQVEATDPITFGAVPLLLAGVAFLGCWLPAWRAARVNPTEALHYE